MPSAVGWPAAMTQQRRNPGVIGIPTGTAFPSSSIQSAANARELRRGIGAQDNRVATAPGLVAPASRMQRAWRKRPWAVRSVRRGDSHGDIPHAALADQRLRAPSIGHDENEGGAAGIPHDLPVRRQEPAEVDELRRGEIGGEQRELTHRSPLSPRSG